MFDSMAEYPHWFVVACSIAAVGGTLWILMKLLKLAVWAFFFALVVVALVAAAGFLLR
jgi:hypothetical protein